jgi:hypothetical protein
MVLHDLFEISPACSVYLRLRLIGEGAGPAGVGPDPWAAAEEALRPAREIRAEGKVVPGGTRVILAWRGAGRGEGSEGLLLQDPAGAWFPLRRLPEVLAAWGERAASWAAGATRVELQAIRSPEGVSVLWAGAWGGGHLMVEAAPDPEGAVVRVERLRTRSPVGPEEEAALRAAAGEIARDLQVRVHGRSLEARWRAPGQTPLAAAEAVVRALTGGRP